MYVRRDVVIIFIENLYHRVQTVKHVETLYQGFGVRDSGKVEFRSGIVLLGE